MSTIGVLCLIGLFSLLALQIIGVIIMIFAALIADCTCLILKRSRDYELLEFDAPVTGFAVRSLAVIGAIIFAIGDL